MASTGAAAAGAAAGANLPPALKARLMMRGILKETKTTPLPSAKTAKSAADDPLIFRSDSGKREREGDDESDEGDSDDSAEPAEIDLDKPIEGDTSSAGIKLAQKYREAQTKAEKIPRGWRVCLEKGTLQLYYWNIATNKTQFAEPTEAVEEHLLKQMEAEATPAPQQPQQPSALAFQPRVIAAHSQQHDRAQLSGFAPSAAAATAGVNAAPAAVAPKNTASSAPDASQPAAAATVTATTPAQLPLSLLSSSPASAATGVVLSKDDDFNSRLQALKQGGPRVPSKAVPAYRPPAAAAPVSGHETCWKCGRKNPAQNGLCLNCMGVQNLNKTGFRGPGMPQQHQGGNNRFNKADKRNDPMDPKLY